MEDVAMEEVMRRSLAFVTIAYLALSSAVPATALTVDASVAAAAGHGVIEKTGYYYHGYYRPYHRYYGYHHYYRPYYGYHGY